MGKGDFFHIDFDYLEVPVLLIDVDTDGVFTYGGLNPILEKLIGICNKDIVGKRPEDVPGLFNESMAAVRANYQRCLKINDVFHYEEKLFIEGKETWWMFHFSPLRDETGRIHRFIGIAFDVTERKQKEDEYRIYQNIVSSTTDIISLVDTQYIYRVVNDSYLKFHQKKREEIVGRTVAKILGENTFNEIVKKNLDRCLNGEVIQYQSWFQYPVIGRRLMEMTYSPYHDENGVIAGVVVNGKDITEFNLSEKALKQRMEYERVAAECMSILVEPYELEDQLPFVLDALRTVAEVSRVYIFRNEDNPETGVCMTQIHEVVAEGILPQIDNPNLQHLPYREGAPSLLSVLQARRPYAQVVSELHGREREILEAQNILSILILPIFYGIELWGFIGFDDCKTAREWQKEDVNLLQVVADGIGATILRKRTEEALRESEKRIRRKLNAILSPEADISALELSDIIDSENIQKLMDEFYRLTNIGIGMIDLHGRVLVETGWQDICTKFHRMNPESCQLCIESDLELSRNVPAGAFKQYRCKNNMWDIATPIMLGDKHVGNIFLGQFLFDDEIPAYQTFRQQARRYGFNEQEYMEALDRVPRWSREMVNAAMSFYTAFAGMIGNLSYSNIKLANALEARKRAEEEQHRLNRELQAITNCNQTLLRAVDEQTLLNEICRIICDEAGYRLAWVGYVENDAAKTVRPVAWAGFDYGFIENADLSWADDTEHGRGPDGIAIRSGEIIYVQDFTTDPRMAPWRESALQHGLRSSLALPLKDEDNSVFGVLLIYSSELNAITPQEIKLMQELSGDLAFGIITLRTRVERKRAEKALEQSRADLQLALEAGRLGDWKWNIVKGEVEWSDRCKALYGLSPDIDVSYERFLTMVHPDDRVRIDAALNRAVETRTDYDVEKRIIWPDGSVHWTASRGRVFCDAVGQPLRMAGVTMDITERKQAEDISQSRLRLLEFAASHTMDEFLTATLDEMEALTGSTIGFYHFLEEDQKTLSLQNWSTKTLQIMCSADAKGMRYDITNVGVWVDCIYERRPVIHNDYASLPHRKGMPEGHAPVIREVVVPIFRSNLITAIIGVGNKATDYNDNDVEIVSKLGDLSWDITERKRAETELRESEAKFRSLAETSPVGILIHQGGRCCYVNPVFETVTGYTQEEILMMNFWDLVHPEFRELVRERGTARWHKEQPPAQYEFKVLTKDAEERWVELQATGIKFEGQPAVLATLFDITERKHIEENVRQSEKRKTILNEIANIFLTIPDEEMYGEVLQIVLRVMNSSFGLFGYIGENGDLILPTLTRDIWDECRVPDKSIVFSPDSWGNSLWGHAIREKKTFYSAGPFHTPPGHIPIHHFLTSPIIFGQKTIALISVANKEKRYTEEDKKLLECVTSFISPILNARLQRDLHERKRIGAEEALKESEEKYRLLIENAGEAIFIIQNGTIEFSNRKTEEIVGYPTSELVGMPFADFIFPEDRTNVLKIIEKSLHHEKSPGAPAFKIRNRSVPEVWVQLSLTLITWKGQPASLCFLKDITEQKAIEAQFLQAQKMEAVGRLAGGVAHDFNNMLMAIQGYSDLIMQEIKQNVRLRGYVVEIQKAVDRSASLTRQLLAFSRRQMLIPKIVNLNDLISNMLKMLFRLIGEDIDLVTRLDPALMNIKVDPGQIEQIVMNLIVNARDAMPTGGKITIVTKTVFLNESDQKREEYIPPGNYILLAISDTGCGMDKRTLEQIFEPFFTTKESGKGTGLGLATVYGIVKQSEGHIHVESTPGKGTTFRVYFPCAEGYLERTEKDQFQESQYHGTETILLVEDDNILRMMILRMLKGYGYTVYETDTGNNAIELLNEHEGKIDLIITDVVMPKMSGIELYLQTIIRYPNIKVLFMSGYTNDTVLLNEIADNHLPFFHKPVSSEVLGKKIRELLDE